MYISKEDTHSQSEELPPQNQEINLLTSVSFSKHDLFFKSVPNKIAYDTIELKNTGTTCIYFKWQKVCKPYKVQDKKGDGLERFFCYYSDSKLAPQESKVFTFSFFSEKNGTFSEDWVLITSPLIKNQDLNLHMSGMCLHIVDRYSVDVNALNMELHQSAVRTMVHEMVLDITSSIQHEEPPLPDMTDPETFEFYFLTLNKKYKYWF